MKYILLLLILCSCHISTPSEGKKNGRIVKLSKCGLLCQTWEGELIRGGMNDGTGSLGGSFQFTIENKRLVNIAETALENQHEVILFYHTEFITLIFRSESMTPCFVDDIQIISH